MSVNEIDRLYELLFLWGFAIAAAASLLVAKLVQRIGRGSASLGRILLSYVVAAIGAFGALWLAFRLWPQLNFTGFTVGTLLVMQIGYLAADIFTKPRRQAADNIGYMRPRGWPWKAAIWLLGLTVAYGSARLVVNDDRAREVMAAAPADAAEAHAWRAAPEALRELRRLFPDDYRRIIAEHPAPPGILAQAEPERDPRYDPWLDRIRDAVGAFMLTQQANILRAPDDELLAIARAERELFAQLQPYPRLCAAWASGTVDRSDPAFNQQAPPALVDAMGTLLVAQLRAARAGLDRPTTHDRAILQGQAQAELAALLDAGPPEMARLLDNPATTEQAEPALRCRATLAYLDALLALPPALATVLLSATPERAQAAETGR